VQHTTFIVNRTKHTLQHVGILQKHNQQITLPAMGLHGAIESKKGTPQVSAADNGQQHPL
jgi:hypothetical protein